MGSSSKKRHREEKKHKHRERERSVSDSPPREKRHKRHHHHHKDRKREKKRTDYESEDSDVICVSPTPVKEASPPEQEATTSEKTNSAESLSIEETNKLRAKLGLKPLDVSSSSASSRGPQSSSADKDKKKDDWGEFYHKPADNIAEKVMTEKLRRKLEDKKEKRKIDKNLSRVKLLGESDSEDDAVIWVEKSRKIEHEKQIAQKRAKMLEELDQEFGVGEVIESEMRQRPAYSAKHLKGIEVEHQLDNFEEGKTVILTLKDKDVLDEKDDVLVNVNMLDNERYEKSNLNKKITKDYNPYDNEEVDEFGMVRRKALLNKYDEVIDGEKRESFKIGMEDVAPKRPLAETVKEKLSNKRIESLVLPELKLTSDYYSEEEIKFKKPKKKVKKIRQKGKVLTADELEAQIREENKRGLKTDNFEIDDVPAVKEEDLNIKVDPDDDEWLQKALHKTRKKKAVEATDVQVPTALIKEEPEDPAVNGEGGNIVLNATAEFCRTLGDIPTYGKAGNRDEEENLLDFEQEMDIGDEGNIEDTEDGGRWNSVEMGETRGDIDSAQPEAPILDEEPDLSKGVGAALRLAMSKGYLEKEDSNRPSNSRLAHLQAKHYSIEDKTFGDDDKFGGRRERYSGPIQDFREKSNYNPNVKLEYIDDDGHLLKPKEAFRYLSHKFHGKGPGKNKIEKRLKKSEQEGLMMKMSSTDTPLGTLSMLQSKQKETQSPYIVLSGSKNTHSTTIAKTRR